MGLLLSIRRRIRGIGDMGFLEQSGNTRGCRRLDGKHRHSRETLLSKGILPPECMKSCTRLRHLSHRRRIPHSLTGFRPHRLRHTLLIRSDPFPPLCRIARTADSNLVESKRPPKACRRRSSMDLLLSIRRKTGDIPDTGFLVQFDSIRGHTKEEGLTIELRYIERSERTSPGPRPRHTAEEASNLLRNSLRF